MILDAFIRIIPVQRRYFLSVFKWCFELLSAVMNRSVSSGNNLLCKLSVLSGMSLVLTRDEKEMSSTYPSGTPYSISLGSQLISFRAHVFSSCHLMMTSSNGNIFRVTCPLCGEFTGPGEFPTQRPLTRSFDVFFDLRLNKRLSKQPWGWWFETPSQSLWRQRNVAYELLQGWTRQPYFSKFHSSISWLTVSKAVGVSRYSPAICF